MNVAAIASAPVPVSTAASIPAPKPASNLAVSLVRRPESPKVSPKIQQAARQFETQLLTSLLASLETSLGSVPGSEESGVSQQYHSLATQGLAGAWAAAGGIGIARILTRALTQAPKTAFLPALPASLPLASLPMPGLPAPGLPATGLPANLRLPNSSFPPRGR